MWVLLVYDFIFPLVHFRNKEVTIPCQLTYNFRLARLLSVSSIKMKVLCSEQNGTLENFPNKVRPNCGK